MVDIIHTIRAVSECVQEHLDPLKSVCRFWQALKEFMTENLTYIVSVRKHTPPNPTSLHVSVLPLERTEVFH